MNGGKPLAIDLFCGLGGWAEGFLAEGYRVIGFDIDPRFGKVYPGEFVLADVRNLDGRRFRDATVIVASPPCDRYTRLRLPWRRRGSPNAWPDPPKDPDLTLWGAVIRVAKEAHVPFIIENVEGAIAFHGTPVQRWGSRCLWGDVPLLYPMPLEPKGNPNPRSMRKALRAKIPLPLARAVARGFL
jgi:DNA (cytosine-5)-methyltransferase 1